MSTFIARIKELVSPKTAILLGGIFILSLSLSFGLGYIIAKNNSPAPIIINQK